MVVAPRGRSGSMRSRTWALTPDDSTAPIGQMW